MSVVFACLGENNRKERTSSVFYLCVSLIVCLFVCMFFCLFVCCFFKRIYDFQ